LQKTETNITIVIGLLDQKSTIGIDRCHIIKPITTTMFISAYCKNGHILLRVVETTLARAFDATTDAYCNHKGFPAPAETYINRLGTYEPGAQKHEDCGRKSIQTPLFTDLASSMEVATCISKVLLNVTTNEITLSSTN
jgi:hypothetical protein